MSETVNGYISIRGKPLPLSTTMFLYETSLVGVSPKRDQSGAEPGGGVPYTYIPTLPEPVSFLLLIKTRVRESMG